MSPASLAVVLFAALGLLAVVINHCYARLALVELSLNEGLPPGHQPQYPMVAAHPVLDAATTLDPGVHIFLSRNCHACQRLIEELDQNELQIDAELQLHYIDRPRPIATAAANRHRATLFDHQAALTNQLGADPLPYTIAVGSHALTSRAVTPTTAHVLMTARDAGIMAREF